MKLSKEEKNDIILRIKLHILFLEIFKEISKDKLDITEINCLNDVSNCLKDLKKLFEE